MKHVVMSKNWVWGTEPFPAYRCELIFGRNKRDREFLPVQGVAPVVNYRVRRYMSSGEPVYSGTDKAAAEAAKAEAVERSKSESSYFLKTFRMEEEISPLPEGQFKVIKTREKGTILVVPGEDPSDRCLLFVGCAGGFRGGVSTLPDGTTGSVLKTCSASNNCESQIEVIAILDKGQTVAFWSHGRRSSEIYVYTWDGDKISQQHYSKAEWDQRKALNSPLDDAEVL